MKRVCAEASCDRLDENTAGAYIGKELSEHERLEFEGHLIVCAECRTAIVKLARAVPLADPIRLPLEICAPVHTNRWVPRFAYSVAAALVIAGCLLFVMRASSPMPADSLRNTARSTAGSHEIISSENPPAKLSLAESDLAPVRRVRRSRSALFLSALDETRLPPAPPIFEDAPPAPSLVFQPPAHGRLFGTVASGTDRAGASVNLTLVNISSGIAQTRSSDADGKFQFLDVPAGQYMLSATDGSSQVSRPVRIQAGAEVALDLNAAAPVLTASLPPSMMGKESPKRSAVGSVQISDIAASVREVESLRHLKTSVGLVGSSLQEFEERASSSTEIGLIPRSTLALSAIDHGHSLELGDAALKSSFRNELKKTKRVGAKVFEYQNGVWVDQQFLSGSRYPIYQFEYKSRELKAQTKNDAVLKEYLRVGHNVIVVHDKRVIAVMER